MSETLPEVCYSKRKVCPTGTVLEEEYLSVKSKTAKDAEKVFFSVRKRVRSEK